MNKNNKLILMSYSLLLVLGGLVGFIKSASLASLTMSLTFAAVLVTLTLLSHKITKAVSYAAFTLVLLDSFFSYRFLKTWRFMPSGMLALLTFGVIVAFIKLSDPIQNKARRAP